MLRKKKNASVVIALLVVLPALNAAPAPDAAQRDQMLLAIAGAVDGGATAVPAQALDGALARAAALTGIYVDSGEDAIVIRLDVSGHPAFDIAYDAARSVLHMDLADTVVLPQLGTMAVGSATGRVDVTARLIEVQPQFVTRIEVTTAGPGRIEARTEPGRILLTLAPSETLEIDARGVSPAAFTAARIREIAARQSATIADDLRAIDAALKQANEHVAESELLLLQAELMDAAPAHPGIDAAALRGEFERNRSQTALLAAERQLALEGHADGIKVGLASLTEDNAAERLAAFSDAIRAFEDTIQAVRGRIEQQMEFNALFERRMLQVCGSLDATRQASAQTTLDQMDVAFATMRSDAAPATTPAAADAVGAAPVAIDVPRSPVNAALSEETAVAPPAARSRATEHRIALDTAPRRENMAVLRSGAEELAEAENNGVIRLAQQPGVTEATGARPATPVNGKEPGEGPRSYRVPKTTGTRPAFNLYNEDLPASQDPLRQLVDIDFREMELSNVVSLLAQKGQINVIAGTDVSGTVTANLKNIPLGRAIEIVLRMNGLGIVEEAGVYRITPYEEAVAAQRETRMVFLQNAQAGEVKETLDDVLAGRADGELIAVSANPSTNVILLAGPLEAVEELQGVVGQLDVAEPVIPTMTIPIKLNYSEPLQMLPVITPLVSPETGKVTADPRSRHIIVTDTPVKVQEIQSLIKSIDLPVKQVSIDAMIVDASLDDEAATGVDWVLNTVSTQAPFDGAPNFSTGAFLPITNPQVGAATLAFGVISDSINLRAEIQARVESTDSQLLANPVIVTVENQPATINIAEEIPYQELTQTSEGGQIASTRFKDVGTVLLVTPRVTHDNHILVTVDAKQSNTTGISATGVPIEAKREASTTLRMKDGQSIFIGGLRKFDEELANRKVPVLGDIPGLNIFFKSQDVTKRHSELLIFLTCNVLPDENYPELTPYQKEKFDMLGGMPHGVNGTRDLVRTYTHPGELRDPIYKWRRAK
jgi:type IV pilus secretin PilQ/predicted competence protein